MQQVVYEGEPYPLSFPLITALSGIAISAVSAELQVIDTNTGSVTHTETIALDSTDAELNYTVRAQDNTLLAAERFDGRRVCVAVTDVDGHVFTLEEQTYIVRKKEPYVVGVDILAPLIDHTFAATQCPYGQTFLDMNQYEKELAAITMFDRFTNIRWRVEGVCDNYCFRFMDLTPEEYAQLPPRFIQTMLEAIVTEIDFDADCTNFEKQAAAGLLSSSSGDQAYFFKSGRPLERPFSKQMMAKLNPYLCRTEWSVCRG